MQPNNHQPIVHMTDSDKHSSLSTDLMCKWTDLVLPTYEKSGAIIFEYKAESLPKSHPYSATGVEGIKAALIAKGIKEKEIGISLHGSATLITIPWEAIKRVGTQPNHTGWGFLQKLGLMKKPANGDTYRHADNHATGANLNDATPVGFYETSLSPDANEPAGADAIYVGEALKQMHVKDMHKRIEWHYVDIDADKPLWYADAGHNIAGREMARQINDKLIRYGIDSTVEKIQGDYYIVSVPVSEQNVSCIKALEETHATRTKTPSQPHAGR